MSSKTDRSQQLEGGLALLACTVFTLWYARGQLLFSLYFAYQIAQLLFPHWLPPAGGSGK